MRKFEGKRSSKDASSFWVGVGFIVSALFPLTLLLLPIASSLGEIISKTVQLVSILMLVYCALRLVLILGWNKYLPQIPLPRNDVLRIGLLVASAVVIGIMCPLSIAILWLAVALTCYFLGAMRVKA